MEETCLPPSLVPLLASADFAASVFAYLPRRRFLTPRLGGGLARFLKSFMWPCSPCSQPPLSSCSPATCRAFSYSWLSCCDSWVCARMGCCVPEIEDFVKVSGPLMLLFDVLAFVDALMPTEKRSSGFPGIAGGIAATAKKLSPSAGNATGCTWPGCLPRWGCRTVVCATLPGDGSGRGPSSSTFAFSGVCPSGRGDEHASCSCILQRFAGKVREGQKIQEEIWSPHKKVFLRCS